MSPTQWSGRVYQEYIRRGFNKARHFVSVSTKTQRDLHRFLTNSPASSEVVYNGLNYPFAPLGVEQRISELEQLGFRPSPEGFILHVGGNQWYKNRLGVIEIYAAYAREQANPLELWMFGREPTSDMVRLGGSIGGRSKIRFIAGSTDLQLNAAYAHARALLFPSHAEGFGWPIVEAMACGCPVLTTSDEPMTEVGGEVAVYLPQYFEASASSWAYDCARVLTETLNASSDEAQERKQAAMLRSRQFDAAKAILRYEEIYTSILNGNPQP